MWNVNLGSLLLEFICVQTVTFVVNHASELMKRYKLDKHIACMHKCGLSMLCDSGRGTVDVATLHIFYWEYTHAATYQDLGNWQTESVGDETLIWYMELKRSGWMTGEEGGDGMGESRLEGWRTASLGSGEVAPSEERQILSSLPLPPELTPLLIERSLSTCFFQPTDCHSHIFLNILYWIIPLTLLEKDNIKLSLWPFFCHCGKQLLNS